MGLGAAALAVGGTAIAAAAMTRGPEQAERPSDRENSSDTSKAGGGADSTGLRWNPDSALPTVAPGGARQADWAQSVLEHYDATGDGTLDPKDGAAIAGSWSRDSLKIVGALVSRYDTGVDQRLDASEVASMGADFADDSGRLSEAAGRDLAAAINGAMRDAG